CLNSWVLNHLVRMLMGSHLTTGLVEGLPVPRWTNGARQRGIARLARMAGGLANLPPKLATGVQQQWEPRLAAMVAREFGLTSLEFADIRAGCVHVPMSDRHFAQQLFASKAGAKRRISVPRGKA